MRYFDYDPVDGISFHETADEARSEAEATLEQEADSAADDGWSDNVDDICWGVVLGSAERTSCEKSDDERFDEIVTYAVRDEDDPSAARISALESQLKAAREENERWKRAAETDEADVIAELREQLAALRARDAGRVERAAAVMMKYKMKIPGKFEGLTWQALTDEILAAADGEVKP